MTVDLSKYDDLLRRLSHEALAGLPEAWDQGRLTITIHDNSLHCQLENNTDHKPPTPSQQLGKLCAELYILMEMDGQQWSQCVINFTRTPPGDSWDFKVNFTYPEPSKV